MKPNIWVKCSKIGLQLGKNGFLNKTMDYDSNNHLRAQYLIYIELFRYLLVFYTFNDSLCYQFISNDYFVIAEAK